LIAIGFALIANAQESSSVQKVSPPTEKKSLSVDELLRDKHRYAEFGLAYMAMSSEAGNKIHIIGARIDFGFYPFSDLLRLGLETGLYSSVNKMPIGSFEYTENGRSHTDGTVNRKIFLIPLLINGSFEFGEKTMFRVGPTVGLMPLFARSAFDPIVSNDDLDNIAIQTKSPFVYGAHVEVSFTVSEVLKFNLGYKYMRLTSFTFADNDRYAIHYDFPTTEMKLSGHQISAGLLFVF
jgi:opacity protein-like surface antigen